MPFRPAIFLSAFTLFFIQPLMGKVLAPSLGGGAAVWITCMVFFQAMLLLGYLMAHGLVRLTPAQQGWMWGLLAALTWLSILATGLSAGTPFLPPEAWLLKATEAPASRLLWILARTVGLPFLLLACASPLIQAWYARHLPGSPFRLYALSNAGSFAGLFAYPLLAELLLPMAGQAWLLAFLLAAFTAVMARLAWTHAELVAVPAAPAPAGSGSSPWVLWILVAGLGTALLVSASSAMGSVLVSHPLVWTLPLGLYLLTFVLVFDSRLKLPFTPIALALLACLLALQIKGTYRFPLALIPAFCGAVFFGGLLVHGFLHSLRPEPGLLTRYYLAVALGGALGGCGCALGAPQVFSGPVEFPIVCILVGFTGLYWLHRQGPGRRGISAAAAIAVMITAAVGIQVQMRASLQRYRDFFGIVRVAQVGELRTQWHGNIRHGAVRLGQPWVPLVYYGPGSGVGRAMAVARSRQNHLRIGLVGLGVGSCAAYARPSDFLRIYEISPRVVEMAGPAGWAFPVVRGCGAQVEVALGDGRASLQSESPQRFDVLVVDAFVGGQIPWHLLTLEAFELYLRHLAVDGILVLHLSSDLPLDRQVAAMALKMDLWALGIYQPGPEAGPLLDAQETSSAFALLSRDQGVADAGLFAAARWAVLPRQPAVPVGPKGLRKSERGALLARGVRPWSDARNSMLDLLLLKPLQEPTGTGGP